MTERAQRERARLSPPDKEVHRTRRRAALGCCRPRLGRALWCAEGYCRRHTHVDSLRTQVLLLCSRQANDERRWGWLRGWRVLGAGSGSRLPVEATSRISSRVGLDGTARPSRVRGRSRFRAAARALKSIDRLLLSETRLGVPKCPPKPVAHLIKSNTPGTEPLSPTRTCSCESRLAW